MRRALLTLLLAASAASCGWNESCQRFFFIEDVSCGPLPSADAGAPGGVGALFGPCTGQCPYGTECTASNLPAAQDERLCTLPCANDSRCEPIGRCVGPLGAAHCHLECSHDGDCGTDGRCAATDRDGVRVCVPRQSPYRACATEGEACQQGTVCARVAHDRLSCTVVGCTSANDCWLHFLGQAVCFPPREGRPSFCGLRCRSGTDCLAHTTCLFDEDAGADGDAGVGACLAP